MSSGSLKDLTKAISTFTSSPSRPASLPLPEDLLEVVNAYLHKHEIPDESDSQRLQEDLLNIYQAFILDKPSRLAPFLAVLRALKPGIQGSGRLLQWWDKLSLPVLSKLGEEKGLAAEAHATLLSTLVYDEDDGDVEDAKLTSNTMAERLLLIWLAKSRAATEYFDGHARFVEGQLQVILLDYGKKRPKDLLVLINKLFVDKNSRITILSLLCEFIRHGPPHLHQLLDTPLFDNMLRCLQIDTSTRVISLAMTALIMFLPHIPVSTSRYLPALFNIYSRMLFWDRERKKSEESLGNDDEEKNENQQTTENENRWSKLSYLLESEDETVPELLHYFTFLYGLYPINFMSYIRKPQRYLRHANFPGADDLDVEPAEIRQRSERFRQVHLLHPNFFTTTIESEITDNVNRWMKSEAADVVAECMALYTPAENDVHPVQRSTNTTEPNADVPEQSLLSQDSITPFQSRHNSWRNTQSTAVASPEDPRASSLHRKLSQASQSMPSIADSPNLRPTERLDSPTIPAQMLPSPSYNHLQDMVNTQKSVRGSVYQTLTNDSVASLALSNNHNDSSIHIDAYLMSLSRETIPRSPSLRPSNADPNVRLAYFKREITLLQNDLNFERYLKHQHLSHIGQLRNKQMREARVEAETQNLINSNRSLKSKLEEAKRLNLQIRTETEKSKAHSRKWETELSAKLKVLREEQKKWIIEREEFKRDLEKAKERTEKLKQLVIASESKELASRQKVQSVESSLDELKRLREEVEKLTLTLRTYEAGEDEAKQAKVSEETAWQRVKLLQMELNSREAEMNEAKIAFRKELDRLQSEVNDSKQGDVQGIRKGLIDGALAASRQRIVEVQKAHNHLLNKFTGLQWKYMELKERQDDDQRSSKPLLGGSDADYQIGSPIHSPFTDYNTSIQGLHPEIDVFEGVQGNYSVKPTRLDTNQPPTTPTNSGARSPSGGTFMQHFSPPKSAGTSSNGDGDVRSFDAQGNLRPKIKPQSDVRVYGRGGVQNIGKKEKEKKDKDKSKDTSKDAPEPKKEKKLAAGMKNFRGFV